MQTRKELIAKGLDPDPLFQIVKKGGPLPGLNTRIAGCFGKEEEALAWLEQNGYVRTTDPDYFVKDNEVVWISKFYIPMM